MSLNLPEPTLNYCQLESKLCKVLITLQKIRLKNTHAYVFGKMSAIFIRWRVSDECNPERNFTRERSIKSSWPHMGVSGLLRAQKWVITACYSTIIQIRTVRVIIDEETLCLDAL